MTFQPRRLADGRICCSREDTLCAKCEAARKATRNLTDAWTPPDAYAKGISAMRAASGDIAHLITADLDERHAADRNVPPDGYAIALAVEQAKREDKERR